jgi:nitronate monooxygenase
MRCIPQRTRFTDLVGCRLPLQLATLGGVGTADLAVAVAQAGGLGMVPWTVDLPRDVDGVLGKGFLLPYVSSPKEVAPAAQGVRVIEFFWGEPSRDYIEAGHRCGALVSWQVGSAEEARAAARAGCDLVVIQGVEAGGHVRGKAPLDILLPEVLAAVDMPVVAAGGIGSAERVADLLAAGADAVRVGTRFLATPESNAHPTYVDALIAAKAEDTVLTSHFDDGGSWPASVRVLRDSLERSLAAGNRSTMPPPSGAEDPLAMPCYAGTSVEFVTETKPAREVVAELVSLLS